MVPEIFKRR